MATRKKNDAPPTTDGQAFSELMQQMAHLPQIPPAALTELQTDYLKQATALWNASLGQGEAPAISDRRFAAPEWRSHPAAHFMTQLYLLNGGRWYSPQNRFERLLLAGEAAAVDQDLADRVGEAADVGIAFAEFVTRQHCEHVER